jgi:O-antigen ligase
MPIQWGLRNSHKPLTAPIDPAEAGQSPLSRRLIMIWLAGIMVLLPLDIIKLPLNMTLVDVWILMALPLLWLSFVRGPQIISLPYAVPMWLIFVASFVSTFAAPAPGNSFVVVLKEAYAYVWFVTLTAVLATLSARDLHRILAVWAGVVFLHGFVIVAQFLSPDFWRLVASFANKSSEYEIYRPSGFFMNANSAAFFQLLGFVPLMLASPSRKAAVILGILLLPTMLATGSMGAAVAFTAGLTVAVIAISLSGRMFLVIKIFVRLAITISLLGGLLFFIVSHNQRYQEHFERIFFGRAERSSGGRFDLWQRGIDAFLNYGVFIWGVGPENFREVDPKMTDNQLHNDFLAFLVERGLVGTLGLVLFAILVVSRAAYMVLIANKYPDRARLAVVVFLAASVAAIVESLTHQTFHFRELWLIWALQEAMLFKMTTTESEVELTTRRLNGPPGHLRGSVVQPDLTGG